jgi:hypothetical protein
VDNRVDRWQKGVKAGSQIGTITDQVGAKDSYEEEGRIIFPQKCFLIFICFFE